MKYDAAAVYLRQAISASVSSDLNFMAAFTLRANVTHVILFV